LVADRHSWELRRDDEHPITVVIADDQQMVRRGLRVILDGETDITVLAEAGDGAEAVELVRREPPTVALLDIRMPVMDGLVAARKVIELSPDTSVLILTTFDADDYVYEALRAGASGFLLKDAPAEQLIAAVRTLAAGDALIDPSITRRLIARFAMAARPSTPVPAGLDQLTPRELEVFRLLARGLSNVEIANQLVIEENTVKTHVSRILLKLGLRDRVQAVVLAYESGLVVPDLDSLPGAADQCPSPEQHGDRKH
jgi:DNA-binding NarL/FixJ family response regulator